MNETHEPSYYEIALTNRQVLVAFVFLLLSVLGAFIGGVWLGRGSPERPDLSTVIAAEAPSDLDAVEELSFFSEEGNEGRPARNPSRPDLGRENADRQPPPRQESRDERPADDSPPAEEPPPPAPQPSAPPPEPPQQVTEPPPPTAPPPTAPPPPPPTVTQSDSGAGDGGPGFVIQVFSGRDEAQAQQVLQRLKGDGQRAFLSPVKVGSLTMYRVRVGVFRDRAAADRVANAIRTTHKLDTWITAVDN